MLSKRAWFTLHGWLAVPVWILFTFICLTGAIAVFSHEITWLANPDARAVNPEGEPRRDLGTLVEDVHASMPKADIHWAAELEPYMAVPMRVSLPGPERALLYVNPYSGAIQAVNQGTTFAGFMRALHGWLLMPWQEGYSIGYYLVSGLSILMFGSLVSGLVIYKRFWRAFTRPRLRFRRGGRILLGDLHRLAGAWSFWFLLILSTTGMIYFAQGLLWHNGGRVHALPESLETAAVPTTPDASAPPVLPMSELVERARDRFPGLSPARIHMPEHPLDPVGIHGSGPAPVFDDASYRLSLNPYNGEIVSARSPGVMTPLEWAVRLADPLHFGTWGGLVSKALWCLFGLVLAGLSITGFLIWRRRLVPARVTNRVLQKAREQQPCPRSAA